MSSFGPARCAPRPQRTLLLGCALLSAFAVVARAQEAPLRFEGPVPVGGGDYFEIAFEVPEGIREIEVAHRPLDDADTLDWGLEDPNGFRGYGGGNLENAIVGELAASRSYLPGPIPAGRWLVTVGKARLRSAQPGYRVDITLRTAPTLPAATDRRPFADTSLSDESRFYAGDLHVHSEDSGDAVPSLLEIAAFAAGRGLDFIVVTDHNTSSHVDRLAAAQEGSPGVLLVPGVEFTTYGGHATGFGATAWVDHRIGREGRSVPAAIAEMRAQGALFSINHPALDLGDVCIGCAWAHVTPLPGTIHGVEIATGGYRQAGFLFADAAIAFWEELLDEGHHVAALGGSDDHQAGSGNGSPIGDPTTLIFAANLSVASLRTGIINSRTVVKLQGPEDPMIVLDTIPARAGDTAVGRQVLVKATITDGVGQRFRFVQNGLGVDVPVTIETSPQDFDLLFEPDPTGTQRIRAEVLDGVDEHPRTITSYVWLRAPPSEEGCACRGAGGTAPPWSLGAALALAVCFRRRRHRRGAGTKR
jgi:hypothetical protein